MIRRTIFVLTALMLMTVGGQAYAESNDHAVLLDKRGGVVYNSTGNCVRTQWTSSGDPCAPEAAPKPAVTVMAPPPLPPPPAPVKHTVISEAARTVYFPFNKANLTEQSKAQLDTLANTLKAAKDIESARILGAADRVGSKSYNDKLSQKRAEIVRDYLIARGYANANVTHTRWVGKSEPITNCSKKLKNKKLIECLQNDRRVQLEIVYKSEVMMPAPTASTTIISSPPAAAAPVPAPVPMKPVR